MKNNNPVKEFDLDRYLGTWYEIARYENSFEKKLVGVTATYSLMEKGKIRVVNKGYQNTLSGKLKVAEGKAYVPYISQPSKIRVSFFWIFYGDYFVLDLDADYQWALVGSSTPDYLWILSRKPHMDDTTYEMILDLVKSRNYSVNKLVRVLQP